MITKRARMVINFEDEQSTLMVGDLRRFLTEIEGADNDTPVLVGQALSDGVLSDIFEAEWEQR